METPVLRRRKDRDANYAALQASLERFRTLADGTPVMIWVTDPTGAIEYVNLAYQTFFGVMLEQVQSGGWQPLVHPDDSARYVGEFLECTREGRPFRAQARVRRADGEWRWVDSQGQPRLAEDGQFLGMAGSALDITESKQVEEDLRNSEERFRSSIESLNEAFLIVSAVREGGRITDFCYRYVNDAACRLSQHTREQMIGHTMLELMPQQQENGLFGLFAQVVESGAPRLVRAYPYQEAVEAPPELAMFFDIHAVRYGDGLIITMDNVTEQVRLEAKNLQAIQHQQIHHRLAEQREQERHSFARDIHDGPVQTLASLTFNLQFLKEVYTDPALQVELDQIGLSIKSAIQELREVINELRPPSVIRFGLAKAIQAHTAALRERYPHIHWSTHLTDDSRMLPEPICLTLFRVYQEAANNIVRHAEAKNAWVNFRLSRAHALLEIRDDGKGISNAQDFVHLTSHSHFGLAGMAERVESIGGEFDIKAQPNLGTTIHVRVPIHWDAGR